MPEHNGMTTLAPRPLWIRATAHHLPSLQLSSAALDQQLGLAAGRVEAASGVRQRYVAAPQESAAQLAAEAGRLALAKAGVSLDEVDCLVAVSATMDQAMPSNAALVHAELGLSARGVPAFDINASCLGFLAALDNLSWPLAAGRYRCLLLVAADLASCGLDWSQLESSAIFGDGAAAAVLSPSPAEMNPAQQPRLLASRLRTYSEGVHWCEIPAGGSRFHPRRIDQAFTPLTHFRMDGKKVFRLASRYLPDFVSELLAEAGLVLEDIDWIVPHQASHLALAHLSQRLGFAPERVINIFADYGNQVAASLPTALDLAIADGRIQRGQTLLLLGTGAGLSLGGAVVIY